MPSFEPMSTTRSSLPSPSSFEDFGVELGEIVAQQLGHAAGVGIFRREDDDRIDRKAELHQLAVRGNRAASVGNQGCCRGTSPTGPSGSPAACSRATAWSRAARARRPGSTRPERWRRCRRRGRLWWVTRASSSRWAGASDAMDQALGASAVDCAQYQSTVGGRPCASGTCGRIAELARACAMSGQRRSVPPAGAGPRHELDLAAGMGRDPPRQRRRW